MKKFDRKSVHVTVCVLEILNRVIDKVSSTPVDNDTRIALLTAAIAPIAVKGETK